MKARLAGLLVVSTLVSTLWVAAPVKAHTDACFGSATMITSTSFSYPPTTSSTTPFSLSPAAIGACVANFGALEMTGVVRGSCGAATGYGTTSSGHNFTLAWVGTTLAFTGGVEGSLEIAADLVNGESCLSGADRFLVAGAVTLVDNVPPVFFDTLVPPGGPAGPSNTCGVNVTDGTIGGIPTRVRFQTMGTETWVCVRIGSYGGKLVVSAGTGLPPVPTTDSAAGACKTANPASVLVEQAVGPTETPVLLAVHRPTDQTWLCLQVDTFMLRVVVTTFAGPGSPVSFEADTGTPDI